MSKRESMDEILDSYRNGQMRQFVEQLDAFGEMPDFIDYVIGLGYSDELPAMMKAYFRIKAR